MSNFTHIDHDIRREFRLTLNEYAIADSIFYLSRGKWCDAARAYLGDFIDISERAVIKIINRLIKKGLVERNGRKVRTAEKWNLAIEKTKENIKKGEQSSSKKVNKVHVSNENALTEGEQSSCKGEQSSPGKVNKVHLKGEQSSPLINTDNTDINTDIQTLMSADKSADQADLEKQPDPSEVPKDDPVLYFRKKLFATFESGYEAIYHEKLLLNKNQKEIGCISKLIRNKILNYKTHEERVNVLKRKIDLLKEIAEKRNQFQNWKFLPSQLLMRWEHLVEGCVMKGKGNSDFDFDKTYDYWKKKDEEWEREHAAGN